MKDDRPIISNQQIRENLTLFGFKQDYREGRLMLLELISKAGAGYYNSHTEEGFLKKFKLIRKDRMPNRKGMMFICEMVYSHSNVRPQCCYLMTDFRKAI